MVRFDFVEWDDANAGYIAEHGISPEEVEDVLYNPVGVDTNSRSSGRPARIGWARTGRRLFVVYEVERDGGVVVVRPTNAYELETEPETGW